MYCLNLFAKPKMQCSSLRLKMICGFHVDRSNRGQYKSACRSLLQKGLLHRYVQEINFQGRGGLLVLDIIAIKYHGFILAKL